MGQRGIELVNENCTNEVVGKQLVEYFEKMVLKEFQNKRRCRRPIPSMLEGLHNIMYTIRKRLVSK